MWIHIYRGGGTLEVGHPSKNFKAFNFIIIIITIFVLGLSIYARPLPKKENGIQAPLKK
jgi:hypothetical protein